MDLELNEAQVNYAQAILECGIIELEPLQEWLAGLQEVPGDLGEALSEAQLVDEFELTNTLGRGIGLSVASEIELEMDAAPHPKIPRDVCVELLCIPLSDQDLSPLPIAVSNPFDDVGLQYISELVNGAELKLSLAAPSHIRAEISACYGTEEEWNEYLAEQDRHQQQEMLNEPSHLNEDSAVNESVHHPSASTDDYSADAKGRPQSIPDWSKHCPDGAERLAALESLIRGG